jgi:hypothetical protein
VWTGVTRDTTPSADLKAVQQFPAPPPTRTDGQPQLLPKFRRNPLGAVIALYFSVEHRAERMDV